MASGRINYDRTTILGHRLEQVCRNGVACRRDAEELSRILDKYSDDAAGLATDLGAAQGNVAAIRDLLKRTAAEMGGTAIVAVAQDAQTQTRTFLDSLG